MENVAPTSIAVQQKSGYLLKCSSAGPHQKRFFEINGEYLTYFKTEKKRKMLEAISIPGAANIRLTDGYDNSSKFSSAQCGQKTILIDLRDRQYGLLADSVEDAQSWIKELLRIRDVQAIKCLLDRPVRQNWANSMSGVFNADTEEKSSSERGRNESLSLATMSADVRSNSVLTVEDVHPRRTKPRDLIRFDCCFCFPVIF